MSAQMQGKYASAIANSDAIAQSIRYFESLTYRDRRSELWHNEAHEGKPRFLYKFSGMRSDDQWATSRLNDMLVVGQLRLGSIANFNDPFDAKAKTKIQGSAKQFQSFLNNLGRPSGQRRTSKLTRIVRKRMAAGGLPGLHKVVQQSFSDATLQMGVSCFSADPRNILMWSHYADHHRGYCVMYERSRSLDPFSLTLPVNYSKNYPEINPLSNDGYQDSVDAICTKSKDWEYEQEHRLVIHQAAGKYLPYDVRAVVGVIVGCRTTPETVEQIRAVISRSKCATECRIYKAVPSQTSYRVDILRIR